MITRSRMSVVALLALAILTILNARKHLRRQRRNYRHSKNLAPETEAIQIRAIEKDIQQFDIKDQDTLGYIDDYAYDRDLVADRFELLSKGAGPFPLLLQYCIAPKALIPGRRTEKVIGRFIHKTEGPIKRMQRQGYEIEKQLPSGLFLFKRRR
ncbi:MAG: hypothetical protein P1V97_22405 [Planctomycetota bacterium]|nr:hypothetical protein [Planctomycetota bacterium]